MAQVSAQQLNVGEWKQTTRRGENYSRFELRLETGLLVGLAYSNDDGKHLNIYAFFHDPYQNNSEDKTIKYTNDLVKLYKHWAGLMDKVLVKMFD